VQYIYIYNFNFKKILLLLLFNFFLMRHVTLLIALWPMLLLSLYINQVWPPYCQILCKEHGNCMAQPLHPTTPATHHDWWTMNKPPPKVMFLLCYITPNLLVSSKICSPIFLIDWFYLNHGTHVKLLNGKLNIIVPWWFGFGIN